MSKPIDECYVQRDRWRTPYAGIGDLSVRACVWETGRFTSEGL